MHMKKIVLIALAVMMLPTAAGCRNAGAGTTSGRTSDAPSSSAVETWAPDREIKVVVAYPPGSGTDVSARLLLSNAYKYVGQILAIENLEGADGKIGFTALAAAKPDGYTIGFINLPTFTTLALEPDSPFTIARVEPICNHLSEPSVVVVSKDSPYKTLQELIGACKKDGRLKCATNGNRASGHTGAQLFAKAAGFDYQAVAYDGTADQILALQQSKADFSVVKVGDVTTLVTGENVTLRMLAVFAENRLARYPDLPTMKELGLTDLWYGSVRALVAPVGTPQAALDFYADAFKKTMSDEKCIADHEKAGLSLDYMGPAELKELLIAQDAFCREVVLPLYAD